ncbi:MAG: adenylosuccinate lyase [Candidatus Levybacteria bacterium]|nr:adenylosuccinate lyase [Candidatus Levybacteria bacterium]MBI3070162.1 adenylosuccinate lyase [Candidatus Levybacteria bacterium]MBI3092645.1 adenylosuccinate lyase [Candidatus Levybacteria bacterium]
MPTAERQKMPLPLSELTAISILDGRNRRDVAELTSYVSEYNLIRTRIEIEAQYLMALSDIGVVRSFTPRERQKLSSFGQRLKLSDAKKIKKIEDETQHDVTAMTKAFRTMLAGTSLEDVVEMVHFGLTSEDINNLSYRFILKRVTHDVLIPALDSVIDKLTDQAEEHKEIPMLARTHGQAAVPTTVGKELVVFASRLNKEVRELEKKPLSGKLTGAVGNLNALQATYPKIDWISFSENFIRSFGFEPNLTTTQINPYEDMIAFFQNYQRINGIITDFDQDMWRYISDGWFVQQAKAGEHGSSTMPQKVNPIRFENSEGNLGKANALFEYFVRKLPISRLQRDLSDSTVIRDLGVPLGYSLLAYKNVLRGLSVVQPNKEYLAQVLNADWTILSEGAQTIMRRFGIEDPYSLMLKLTRGRHIGEKEWKELVAKLSVDDEGKKELSKLTPFTYLGLAVELTERAIKEIRRLRKK